MGNIKFYKQARCQNHIYHANYLNYSYPFIEQTDFICMTNNKAALVSIKAVLLITNGGASLPTDVSIDYAFSGCLNPRFVGRVFRLTFSDVKVKRIKS